MVWKTGIYKRVYGSPFLLEIIGFAKLLLDKYLHKQPFHYQKWLELLVYWDNSAPYIGEDTVENYKASKQIYHRLYKSPKTWKGKNGSC